MKNLSIIGQDKYAVTRDGRVFSIRANTFLKLTQDPAGYLSVGLSKNGKKYKYLVHRLVALAFIPNEENKPTVNHKDGNKTNNTVDNLEWATYSEQVIHARDNGLRENCKIRICREWDDETIHLICQYIVQGFRPRETANILGVPDFLVKNILRKTQYTDISDEYDFSLRPVKAERTEVNKVIRICEMLELGTKESDIVKALNVTQSVVNKIKTRKCHTAISCNYKF